MAAESSDASHLESPLRELERSFIEEYLRRNGYDPQTLGQLPEAQRHALLAEASVYASAKLAEVESRAHYIHEMHDGKARNG